MYLKGFQDDNGRLTLWSRTTGQLKRKATKYASTTKGYYTILNENREETDIIENIYMRVENDVKPILDKMTCICPCIPSYYSRERMIFSQYLAMQFTKTKAFRRKSQLIYDYFFKLTTILRLINKKTLLNKKQAQFIKNPHQFDEFCRSQDLHSLHELEFTNEIEYFFRFRPRLIVAFDEPCLITSDTPIFLFPNNEIERYPDNGLATTIEYWFPLDNMHLLIMGRPLCPYPACRDRVICPDGTLATNLILQQCCKASNDAQITNCHMEAYGQKSLLQKYEGKLLPKKPPFHITDKNSFNSYYNDAKMDLEPILGHGKPIEEIFTKNNIT